MVTAAITTAATASTMSTDRRLARPRFLTAGIAGLSGVLLCTLAVPRVAATAIIDADGGAVLEALHSGDPLREEQRVAGIDRLARAQAFRPGDGDIALDMARLELSRTETDPDRARRYLERAASLTPNNSIVWSLLARLEASQGASVADVSAYLNLSHLTGRFEWSSILVRIPAELAYWDELDARGCDRAVRDMRRMTDNREFMRSLVPVYLRLGYKERAILLREAFPDSTRKKFFLKTALRAAGIVNR